jgi:hypothetical protein
MSLYNHLVQATPGPNREKRRSRSRRGLSVWQPYSWPRSWRRIAVLTLPLAVIVWLVAATIACLHLVYQDARKPFARFWNSPSRRRGGYGYFSY